MMQFVGTLIDVLQIGQILVLSGTTPNDASSFRVDLENNGDIYLHLSVRFPENIIVRNSRINNTWVNEENEHNLHPFTKRNPIVRGEPFKISLALGETRFHIDVNDKPYCTFDYRMPLETIRLVRVSGDVNPIVQFDHRSVYPTAFPAIQVDDNTVDFSHDIPKAFSPDHLMVITATSYGNSSGSLKFRLSDEANTIEYPFSFNQERGMKYNFDNQSSSKITFNFEETKCIVTIDDTQPIYSIRYRSNQLKKLNGFKIIGENGMHVNVTSVEHTQLNEF